jgi:hypothetical protein
MNRLLWLVCLICASYSLSAQSFEVIGLQETYRGVIGETIKVPLHFKNNTEKPIILVIRKVSNQLGTTQKNYFCIDNNCLDHRTEDYIIKVEPGQVLNSFNVALEAGLAQGVSSIKYLAFIKSSPGESLEFDLNFMVDERPEKQDIYASPYLILHDVYPNPVKDHAYADYTVLNEQVEAKIIIHNILGNTIDEISLPFTENKVKIRAESLNAGVYFYTLYIDNKGVVTRKMIVKKDH